MSDAELPDVVDDEPRPRLTTRVVASFPIRVWTRFNRRNGLLLASGTSDQAVFAVFAALYIGVALLGVWLGSSESAVDSLMAMIDGLAPGVLALGDSPGLIDDQLVRDFAGNATPVWSITGIIAFVVFAWTAVGWVTFLRSAVRDMFGLPAVDGHFAIVKVWDAVAAVGYAVLLLLGGTISAIGTSALGGAFDALGWADSTPVVSIAGRLLTFLIATIIDVIILLTLFTWLSGTDLSFRQVLPACLTGGTALAVLQFSAGWLLGRPPANPLVATFAVLLGLFVWFRLAMIVVLVAAAAVYERADDADLPIVERSEPQRRVDEAEMLVRAAEVRLREARIARGAATWSGRGKAIRAVTRARDELDEATERLANADHDRNISLTGRRRER